MTDDLQTLVAAAAVRDTVTLEDVALWYKIDKKREELVTLEALLRPKIFQGYFKDPTEGVNNFTLPDEFILKGTRRINRNIDVGVLDAFSKKGPNNEPSIFQQNKINVNKVFEYKPSLVVSEYRKLTAEELHIVDQALIIKDGMPALEIAKPSTRNRKNNATGGK